LAQFNYDNSTNGAGPDHAEPNHLLLRLMDGICQHSAEEDVAELQRFQQRVSTEAQILKEAAVPEDRARAAVDAVVALLAKHNESVKTDHRTHSGELAKALRLMVETIGSVSKSSQVAVHQLAVLEQNLAKATAGEDATRFRSKLEVCLKMIREQSETLRSQSEEQVNQLKSFVASSAMGHRAANMLDEPVDPVTGLPTRMFAENLIQDRLERQADCLVGVVTIERFNGLHRRFGQANVDELLKVMSRHLAQRLPEATTLCRWSQTSFLAVTDITSSYAETAQQWRRVKGLKLEKHIEDTSRTALVVLNTALMVEHLRPASSKRALIQDIDRFVMQQSGELVA
jgi:GGDEF domain-containing protein